MKRVLFVSNELFPFAKGGIGRLLHNYLVWNKTAPEPADLQVLLYGKAPEARWGKDVLRGIVIHQAERIGCLTLDQKKLLREETLAARRMPLESSILVANAIERLYEDRLLQYEYIEFPDFMGIAYASIGRKRQGNPAFADAALVVRLHSSMTLIQADEGAGHMPSDWFAAVTDFERHSLRNADLVVGHLPSIVELNQREFGFGPSWRQRCHVEFPPIFLTDEELLAMEKARVGGTRKRQSQVFVFSSRLQPFKRPNLFIRGAVAYLRQSGSPDDQCLIASYGWDKNYIAWLKSLVPDDLREQIRFADNLTQAQRGELLSSATIVIPSTFESLCLFAYESLLMGRRLILNQECLAFGDNPFWKDGDNCLLFDGSAGGLCEAMLRSRDWEPGGQTEHPPTIPYWTSGRGDAAPVEIAALPMDIVITGVFADTASASEAARPWSELGIGRSYLFLDRLYSPGEGEKAVPMPLGATLLDNFGSVLERGALREALTRSTAEYILLLDGSAVPSAPLRAFFQRGRLDARASIIGFPVIDLASGRWSSPLTDCPNLLAQAPDKRVLPVLVRRTLLLTALQGTGNADDRLAPSLVLSLIFSDEEACVFDLPLLVSPARTPHRHPLAHYTADALARARRRCMPQAAAFVETTAKASAGAPHIDEWSLLKRENPAADALIIRAQLSVKKLRLGDASFSPRHWGLGGTLDCINYADLALDRSGFQLLLHASGLELAVFPLGADDQRPALPLDSPDADALPFLPPEYCPDTRALVVRSWETEARLPTGEEGADRNRMLMSLAGFIVEQAPAWHAKSYARFGLAPEPEMRQRMFAFCSDIAERLKDLRTQWDSKEKEQ